MHKLIQPKIYITLSSIMTHTRELTMVGPEDSSAAAMATAEKGGFDQVPVGGSREGIVGLVFVEELENSPAGTTVADHLVPVAKCTQLRTKDGISRAVRTLHTVPASLVADGEKVAGLVHRSDLNKHPARTYFYLWLSWLEMALARLIDLRLPGNAWIGLLGEQEQIQVLGKMQFESRRNNSISPIEYVDLSSLVRVVKGSDGLQRELGFDSRRRVKDELGGLVELRHSIMHPVRTLVSDAASMDKLASREKRLRSITLAVQRILRRS
jgi:CBS domain-containing protein